MNIREILYVIDQMKKHHTVPDVISRMNVMRKLCEILLGIDYLLRNIQFLEMLTVDMFILIHPLEETELGQKLMSQIDRLGNNVGSSSQGSTWVIPQCMK